LGSAEQFKTSSFEAILRIDRGLKISSRIVRKRVRIWQDLGAESGRIWQVWERSGQGPPGPGQELRQELLGAQDLARSGQDLAGLARSGRPGQGSPGGLEGQESGKSEDFEVFSKTAPKPLLG